MKTISPSEMKRVEREMMRRTGTPSLTLMERASTHVADAVEPYLTEDGRLLVLCGAGNNGGDGLAAARILLARREHLRVIVWQLAGEPTPENKVQREKLTAYASRVATVTLGEDASERLSPANEPSSKPLPAATANDADLPSIPRDVCCVVDAMFGTGLSRAMTGMAALCAERVNLSGLPVVAVDIPSGLDGRTGRVPQGGAGVRAAATVTFHRPKDGLFLGDGLELCGRVVIGDIGIKPAQDDAAGFNVLLRGDELLPKRRRNTHKGDYGRVLAIVGSFGMAGAAGICASAALRTGAGLVTVACPREIVPTVQLLCPCATCLPLSENAEEAERQLLPAMAAADALAVGCGLGQSESASALTAFVAQWLQDNDKRAVLDADALNLLARQSFAGKWSARVTLTPHPAEAARLLDVPTAQIVAEPIEAARELHHRFGASIVLKGASSVLISDDGEAVSPYGTAAMAKGGSGDALAGALAALSAGADAYRLHGVRLLQTACALHGLAGCLAEAKSGERGMLATDLCEALGRVPDRIEDERAPRFAACPSWRLSPIGQRVRVTIDRPLGSRHPEHHDMVYPVNYGYVADVLAADNDWQDAYVLGPKRPVEFFEGEVVAVIRREDDVESKWVVAECGARPTLEQIQAATDFTERFFHSTIEME